MNVQSQETTSDGGTEAVAVQLSEKDKKEIQRLKTERLKKQARLEIEKVDLSIEKVKAERASYGLNDEKLRVLIQICRTLISNLNAYNDKYYQKTTNRTWELLLCLAKKMGKGPFKFAVLNLMEEK